MRKCVILAAMLVAATGGLVAPARAGQICRTITMTHPRGPFGNDCVELCQTILRPGQTNGRKGWWNLAAGSGQFVSGPVSGAPGDINNAPTDITSCNATVSIIAASGIVGACTLTMCGPTASVGRKKPRPNLDLSRYTIPIPHIGPVSPGLLESDGGFSRQGPSAVGTPLGAGAAGTSGGR